MIAAGWGVGYAPAGEVRHVEPERWAAVLARRLRYGKSAAPLARRHPGLVPPLIVQAWPAAAAPSLLAGRPLTALAPYSARTRQPVRLPRRRGGPAPGGPPPIARSGPQAPPRCSPVRHP